MSTPKLKKIKIKCPCVLKEIEDPWEALYEGTIKIPIRDDLLRTVFDCQLARFNNRILHAGDHVKIEPSQEFISIQELMELRERVAHRKGMEKVRSQMRVALGFRE